MKRRLDNRVTVKYNGVTMMKKPKMGRPPKRPEDKQSSCIMVRVTVSERRMLEAEAKRRGLFLSALLMESWRNREGD